MASHEGIDAVRAIYRQLEPPDADTWTPFQNRLELWHRIRLMVELEQALHVIGRDPRTLRVLDVGCGVGRSTRLLLEFGIRPRNITAIDLRPEAINAAAALSPPTVTYQVLTSLDDWPTIVVDLCLQCTAFSSILSHSLRRETAQRMQRALAPGGAIFWWDLLVANDFAGGDPLDPGPLFPELEPIYWHRMSVYAAPAEVLPALAVPSIARRVLARLLPRVPVQLSHLAALYRRS